MIYQRRNFPSMLCFNIGLEEMIGWWGLIEGPGLGSFVLFRKEKSLMAAGWVYRQTKADPGSPREGRQMPAGRDLYVSGVAFVFCWTEERREAK
jgi:hypothetical protein